MNKGKATLHYLYENCRWHTSGYFEKKTFEITITEKDLAVLLKLANIPQQSGYCAETSLINFMDKMKREGKL